MQEYDNSNLKPNAQFALGISQDSVGDIPASKKTPQTFINVELKHPLVIDVKQLRDEL